MKRIYRYFSLSQAALSARFFLLSLFLLALTTFSGTVSFVSAQTTSGKACEEIETELKRLEDEKQITEKMQRYKINEDSLHQNLGVLNRAIANGRLLKQEQLEVLADNLVLKLEKEVGQMTPDERANWQKEMRDFLAQAIDRIKGVHLEELDLKLDRITKEQDRLKEQQSNVCKADEIKMTSCEYIYGKRDCRVWTAYPKIDKIKFNDKYGIDEFIVINMWETNRVTFTLSAQNEEHTGYSAIYTGTVSGNRIDGTVKWSNGKGVEWSGQWSAYW